MSSPVSELLLFAAALLIFLQIVGKYFLPTLVLAYALRDTIPRERAAIIKEINIFYRRKRVRLDQARDGKEPPKQIEGDV